MEKMSDISLSETNSDQNFWNILKTWPVSEKELDILYRDIDLVKGEKLNLLLEHVRKYLRGSILNLKLKPKQQSCNAMGKKKLKMLKYVAEYDPPIDEIIQHLNEMSESESKDKIYRTLIKKQIEMGSKLMKYFPSFPDPSIFIQELKDIAVQIIELQRKSILEMANILFRQHKESEKNQKCSTSCSPISPCCQLLITKIPIHSVDVALRTGTGSFSERSGVQLQSKSPSIPSGKTNFKGSTPKKRKPKINLSTLLNFSSDDTISPTSDKSNCPVKFPTLKEFLASSSLRPIHSAKYIQGLVWGPKSNDRFFKFSPSPPSPLSASPSSPSPSPSPPSSPSSSPSPLSASPSSPSSPPSSLSISTESNSKQVILPNLFLDSSNVEARIGRKSRGLTNRCLNCLSDRNRDLKTCECCNNRILVCDQCQICFRCLIYHTVE